MPQLIFLPHADRCPEGAVIEAAPGDNLIELYDIADDFAESRDLSEREPDIVSRLRGVYQQFPRVVVDRSFAARKRREALAMPPDRSQ